jgi:ubiquinone/menaquinone biosynthesis C-methylase UbiE
MADTSTIEPEHNHAISLMGGLARQYGWKRFLDVGAGSGRGIVHLKAQLPDAEITGVEPVEALRRKGHDAGIPRDQLLNGDALGLDFSDNSFDVVFATGVLHHVPTPRKAIEEMLRVAKSAVLISDLNNYGCGSILQRSVARCLRAVGLWKAFQWLKNGGRMDKYSDGDGVFFSYSLFDELTWLSKNGYKTYIFTTRPTRGRPLWDTSHIALLIFVD